MSIAKVLKGHTVIPHSLAEWEKDYLRKRQGPLCNRVLVGSISFSVFLSCSSIVVAFLIANNIKGEPKGFDYGIILKEDVDR